MSRVRVLTRGTATIHDLQAALDELGVEPGEQFVIARQRTLFDAKPDARRGDPETSHEAAKSIDPENLRRSQQAVLEFLREHPEGLTDEDLVEHNPRHRLPEGEAHTWARQSESGLRTRRHELVEAGLVVDSGKRRPLESGRNAIVWKAAEFECATPPEGATVLDYTDSESWSAGPDERNA